MRIGLITTEYPPFYGGGIGTYGGNFARALVQAGHEVHVLIPGEFTGMVDGVRIHGYAPPPDAPEDLLAPGLRAFGGDYERTFHLAARLRTFIQETAVDVLEFQDYLGLAYQALYDRLWQADAPRVPMIVTLHGPCWELYESDGLPRFDPHAYMRHFLEDTAIRWADALVAPSRWLGERTSRRLALPADRVHACPLPFEVPDRLPADRADAQILFVGRLERRKGMEVLTRALPRVFQALPACRIRFIGADCHDATLKGSMRAWMESALGQFSDRLTFDGLQPPARIRDAMAAATTVVIPSTWENFPNVCLEACAAAAPIVASDQNGMSEIIEDGRSGLFFSNGDPDSLSARLIEMLTLDPHRRVDLGEQARERVRALCDPRRIVADRIGHFERVIAEVRARHMPTYPRHLLAPEADGRQVPAAAPPRRLAAVIVDNATGRSIRETLNSVSGASLPVDEIVIVDDRRLDMRVAGAVGAALPETGPKTRVVRGESRGAAAARNLGAAATDAEALLFLESGDVLDPAFIATALSVLERHDDVGAVTPWQETSGPQPISFCPPVPHFPLLLNRPFGGRVALIRREAFEAVGGYHADMRSGLEDWQHSVALLDAGWGVVTVPRLMARIAGSTSPAVHSPTDAGMAFLQERFIQLTPRPFRAHFAESYLLQVQQAPREDAAFDALAQRLLSAAVREVTIYGASRGGRLVCGHLRARGIKVSRFADRNEQLWGTEVESVPVCSLDDVLAAGETAFVIGSSTFAADMTRTIEAACEGRATRPRIFTW